MSPIFKDLRVVAGTLVAATIASMIAAGVQHSNNAEENTDVSLDPSSDKR